MYPVVRRSVQKPFKYSHSANCTGMYPELINGIKSTDGKKHDRFKTGKCQGQVKNP